VVDQSGRITYEEIELNKQLELFAKDEKFLGKFMDCYT